MRPLYLYALLGTRPRRKPGRGLGGEPLRLVPLDGLWVAGGELAPAPALTAAALRGHDAVVRRLAGSVEALLPVRFGTVVPDEPRLLQLFDSRTPRLRAALALVAGCEQMTLRLYGDLSRRAGVAPVSRGRPGDGPGTRYLAARAREHAIPELDPIHPAVRRFVRAERTERHRVPPLLASVYHLVNRGEHRAYRQALARATRGLRGLRIVTSGPWAPYAFAPEFEA